MQRSACRWGMAVDQADRRGGPRQVVDAFTGATDPLARAQTGGEIPPGHKAVRESLDFRSSRDWEITVMKVEVRGTSQQ